MGGGEVGFPACITGQMTSIQGVFASGGVCIQGGGGPGGLQWSGLPPGRGVGGVGGCAGTRKEGSTHPTGMLSCLI